MVTQRITIPRYDWAVDICYDATPRNADAIIDTLEDMGCPHRHLYKAERLLKSGVPNEGLTYSDNANRHTLIVIGHTTDLFQAVNSLSHEANHLEMHICEYFGISPYSEEASYLSGSIKEIIARNAWYSLKRLFLYLI